MFDKRILSPRLNQEGECRVSAKVRVMAKMVWISPHISVALSAEEWREVIAYLAAAPELQSQIIEQLTDALGPDYIEEFTGSIS